MTPSERCYWCRQLIGPDEPIRLRRVEIGESRISGTFGTFMSWTVRSQHKTSHYADKPICRACEIRRRWMILARFLAIAVLLLIVACTLAGLAILYKQEILDFLTRPRHRQEILPDTK
jgi:hypothetical protein